MDKSAQVLDPNANASFEIDMYNRENPRSVINLLPDVMKDKIEETQAKATHTQPELFHMDESKLKARLRELDKFPTPTDRRLRLQFWLEYDRVQQLGRKGIDPRNVYSGACILQYFYNIFLKNPYKLAFMLCPPADYSATIHESLIFSLEEMQEILGMDNYMDVRGKKVPNTKLMELKVKIYEKIEERALGAIPQKVLNLHGNVPPGAIPSTGVSGEDAEKRMVELREQLKQLEARDRMKDVTIEQGEKNGSTKES